MLLDEPLLVLELQREREDDQERLHDALVDVRRELLDGGPVLPDDLRVRPVRVLGDELGDIVDLEVVLDARDQVSRPRGLPAIVVPGLQGRAVGLLLLVGLAEDAVGEGELRVNLLLAEPVSSDIEEAFGWSVGT
jgi:hypothetical protein